MNIVTGSHSAAVAVTRNGGSSWAFTGGQTVGQTSLPQASALPLLPGNNWGTSVKDPVNVPQTQTMMVAVFMRNMSSKTWWQLEASTNAGQTWHVLPKTPDRVLAATPNIVFQTWITPQTGWVVLGSSTRLDRTTDGGQQWSTSALPSGTVVNVNPVSATEGYVLMQRGRSTTMYRTQDGGRHWSRVSALTDL